MSSPTVDTAPPPSEPDRRQRAARRLVWTLVSVFILLALAVPGATCLVWYMRGRAALRQEMAVIGAARKPLTTAAMNSYYAPRAGERDITKLWLAALRPFTGFNQTVRGLIDIDSGVSLLGQTLRNEPELFKSLTAMQPHLDALHDVAREEGVVRFPHDFNDGLLMVLDECGQLQGAAIALEIEFLALARAGDTSGVKRNIATRIRMADTLASEPILVTLFIRQRFHVMALRDIQQYVSSQQKLSDSDLAALQQLIRTIAYQPHLEDAILGQRAMVYQAFHYRFSNAEQLDAHMGAKVIPTTDDGSGIGRPEVCSASLRLLNDLCAASRLSPLGFHQELANVNAELDLLAVKDDLQRWRYQQTLIMLPPTGKLLCGAYKGQAYRDLLDIALAARRYQLKHGQMPSDLAVLAPDYLPALPMDLFTGLPVKNVRKSGVITLYSVGPDTVDHGGECQFPELTPDVAVSLSWPE